MPKLALLLCALLSLEACGGIAERPEDATPRETQADIHQSTVAPECKSIGYYYFKRGAVPCAAGAPLCGFTGGPSYAATTIDKAETVCFCVGADYSCEVVN